MASLTVVYVHDPMCSWCWAYRPTWQALKQQLQQRWPDAVAIQQLVGGLAPDSDEPMPLQMRSTLQDIWRRIEQTVPGTKFNFDFWTQNTPRRSTWPACRAVLAAGAQAPHFENAMIEAIQRAYYERALNPSDTDVLVGLARDIGCDEKTFRDAVHAPQTIAEFHEQRHTAQALGACGFPSLFVVTDESRAQAMPLDYQSTRPSLDLIEHLLAA